MDITKRNLITKGIIFVFLVLFPFGQILRQTINIGYYEIALHPIDVVALTALFVTLFGVKNLSKKTKAIEGLIFIFVFSFIFSLTVFNASEVVIGFLYLLRLISYVSFIYLAWLLVKEEKSIKPLIFKSLILVVFFVSLFGWVQYYLYFDLRSLIYLGWDDHLYRLVSTLLDPGFTGIIVTFGLLATLIRYFKTKNNLLIILSIFFLVTLLFTYSRASYLSFILGLFIASILLKKVKVAVLITTVFVVGILLLPRPAGQGVKLERTYSAISRIENYSKTVAIWKKSPIFGVGYNNLCVAKSKIWDDVNMNSHACSGSDSSILLILATTGIIGLFVFTSFILRVIGSLNKDSFGISFIACFTALIIHSQFTNSIFYPWVMGWLGLLLVLGLRKLKPEM